MRPLDDITVVALEQAVAAPFASRQLADLGARVIKIERPGSGDFARHYDTNAHGHSSHFAWCNRSKESLTLDLKSDAGKKILELLIEKSDVLIQNLAPGALSRLGFPGEELVRKHPRLILCNISGYGPSGPYRDKKAYDALIQAETGFLDITGTEETPSKAGIAIADIAAGMYAFSGILTALIKRGRTERGSVLEISLLDAMSEWMTYPMYYTMGGQAPARTGAQHATIAPYGLFSSGDGRTVMLAIQNDREWRSFCEQVLEKAEIADDPRFRTNDLRIEYRPELRAEIEKRFAELGLEEIQQLLDQARIASASARTVEELLHHPQLEARERWSEVGSEHGPVPALLPAINLSGTEIRMDDIPALGQHSETLLEELGYAQAEIDELRKSGTI